jgi:hypothetical protein
MKTVKIQAVTGVMRRSHRARSGRYPIEKMVKLMRRLRIPASQKICLFTLKKESEKREKTKTVENSQQHLVSQSFLQELIPNPQQNQNQKEELGARKRGAFEVENDVTGK